MKKMIYRSAWIFRALGLLWAGYIIVAYAFGSYSKFAPAMLALSIVFVALSFIKPKGEERKLSRRDYWPDVLALFILLLGLTPLYLYKIYTVPWQINTDEVTIMLVAKKLLTESGTDLFGLSYYFGFPSLIFVGFGWMSNLLGGIDLYHFRIVHAVFGIGSGFLFYVLCRQFFAPIKSFTFAVILGTNHALFAISRMAMRDNTGLFLELLALIFLVHGLKNKNLLATFLGSAAAGLGFYTYFPGRIVVVIWFLVLAVLLAAYPVRKSARWVLSHAGVFMLGFSMVALPVLIATAKDGSDAFRYQKQQFLFYEEGQMLQQTWNNAPTLGDAWKENIKDGLLAFNKPLHDQGYIYPNYEHGFLDRYSSVLLWIGFLITGVRLIRKDRTLQDLLAVVGFLVLYLSFAFFITKAPNYTRLLVILPFTSYFVGEALWFMGKRISGLLFRSSRQIRQFTTVFLVLCAVSVIAWSNLAVFSEFVKRAEAQGNDVGSTARYVESRKGVVNQQWVLAADHAYMYYSWGESWQWSSWLSFFAQESQSTVVEPPLQAFQKSYGMPTTIFVTNAAWAVYGQEFIRYNPFFSVRKVTPDGRLLAIEIKGVR